MKNTTHFDLLIVGAGLSGIGAACHFVRDCPGKTYAVLEMRARAGGTWDLFQYPGIRSDSDMHTLGYDFAPWTSGKAIADGKDILSYIHKTAKDYGVDKHIRFNSRAIKADWNSQTALWTVQVQNPDTGEVSALTCSFLSMCPGYYKYDKGHRPDFKGEADFKGPIVHPQHWPHDLHYAGKKVIVIGSGATAVTLVPQLAKIAAHVTMLQRSPTYVASRPDSDKIANVLSAILPQNLAYKITRAKNIAYSAYVYNAAQKKPKKMKALLRKMALKDLGKDYDVDTHFNPSYNPWDQRLCVVPNSDMFVAIRQGRADVVTNTIDCFTQSGIMLSDGQKLEADIIITATGIEVIAFGEMSVSVDGADVPPQETFGYKGMMFSSVPNMTSVFGYTNASWTLRADLISRYMCRLINYMDERGVDIAMPTAPQGMARRPWIDFQAGYIQRVIHLLPSQGDRSPWTNIQNYKRDKKLMGSDPIDDGAIVFSKAGHSRVNAAE